MLSNRGVVADFWEPLGLQGDQNQSILKEINPEYSVEGLMLKLQYFGHLMWRAGLLEKTLMLVKIEGRGERDDKGQDDWVASPAQWTGVWVSSRRWWRTGKPGMLQSTGSQRVGRDWVNNNNNTDAWCYEGKLSLIIEKSETKISTVCHLLTLMLDNA